MFLVILCCVKLAVTVGYMTSICVCTIESCQLKNLASASEVEEVLNSRMDYSDFNLQSAEVQKKLSFEDSKLEKLPAILFIFFSQLQVLDAKNVKLQEIFRDDFQKAAELSDLDLSNNKINHLENKVFVHLKQLTSINLSHNLISTIHDGAFEGMSNRLKAIDLSFNHLLQIGEIHFVHFKEQKNLCLNFNHNKISEIVSTAAYASGNLKIFSLNLAFNEISTFTPSILEIAELNLNNNKLENLTLLTTTESLKVDNNKLKILFISERMRSVSARNNEIEAVTFDGNLTLEQLFISGNKIRNKIFDGLKRASQMKNLDLSDTVLGALKVDSFAEMKMLEELNLGNTSIVKISFGLFSHLQNLKTLNISDNNLGFIDYHMFTSLISLKSWLISGNLLTKLKDYDTYREIFPKLNSVAIENNNWNCEYLSKLVLNLTKQGIKIEDPVKAEKTDSSVHGLRCTTNANKSNSEEKSPEPRSDSLKEVLKSLSILIEDVERLRSEEMDLNEKILSLQNDLSSLKSDKEFLLNAYSSNTSQLQLIAEQVCNMTVAKMTETNLLPQANEQNSQVALPSNSEPNSDSTGITHQEKLSGLNATETILIIVTVAFLLLVVFVSFHVLKGIFKQNLHRMHQNGSVSQPCSLNTFENSVV